MNNTRTIDCFLLFKTVQDCQISLIQQLEKIREESGLTCSNLDRDCRLGLNAPLYEEVLRDPTSLTSTFLIPVIRRLNLSPGQLLREAFRHYLESPECAQMTFARCEQHGVSPLVFTLYQESHWNLVAHSIMGAIDQVAQPQMA